MSVIQEEWHQLDGTQLMPQNAIITGDLWLTLGFPLTLSTPQKFDPIIVESEPYSTSDVEETI